MERHVEHGIAPARSRLAAGTSTHWTCYLLAIGAPSLLKSDCRRRLKLGPAVASCVQLEPNRPLHAEDGGSPRDTAIILHLPSHKDSLGPQASP